MSIGSLLPSVVYRMAEKADPSSIEKTRNSAELQRKIADFKTRLARVETVDDVFKDRRLLQFLMDATGNGREMGMVGVVKRALTTPADDENVAKRLNKPQLFAAVSFLGLNNGVGTLKSGSTVNELVDAYVATAHEQSLTQGVSEVSRARYFMKNIAAAADDPFKILGDGLLRSVMTTVLGLPDQLAVQSVESQARAITSRVDLAKFKDKDFTEKFVNRYLTIMDQQASSNGLQAPGASVLGLFNTGGGVQVNDLLSNINALRVNIVV